MMLIKLTQGYFTKVDDEDYERLSLIKWNAQVDKKRVRAKASLNGSTMFMSRFILNAPKDKCVDHINGDTLDNRKSNLRLCSLHENQGNSKLSVRNTSGYKGVIKNGSGWRANVRLYGQVKCMGTFKTKEEAALAYNEGAKKYFGEFARLNVIKAHNALVKEVKNK